MRSLHAVLLLGIFIATAALIFTTAANEDPADEAVKFFQKIQSGNVENVLKEFGDNTCHCAPKGGYVAYLRYESNEDPNLAFMLGQKFHLGKISKKELPFNGERFVLPWQKPQDFAVYVPITFDQASAPYFIPLGSAYGLVIPQSELSQFVANPDPGWWKAFTVRLRPTLAPGSITGPDPKLPKTEEDKAVEELVKKGELPAKSVEYMHPRDAGGVEITGDGKENLPLSRFAGQLPRLQSILFGIKIVRRGLIQPWKVRKVAFDEPVVLVAGKPVTLKWPGVSQFDVKELNKPEPPGSFEHTDIPGK